MNNKEGKAIMGGINKFPRSGPSGQKQPNGTDPALLRLLERIAVALEKIAQDTEPTHIISGGDLHLGILRES